MSALSLEWLADTVLWTAALIALVLVLRRPVARLFGPQMAYALWALPILRLIMPPVELPAWLAPAESEPLLPAVQSSEASAAATAPIDQALSLILSPATEAVASPVATQSPLPLLEVVIGVWLVGACSFLFLRFRGYFDMRRKLLENSREVGRAGKVRLIETSQTKAPLAFGVRDKVIALPTGFMASSDLEARDLAVAHELAHHKGNDLLVNIAVQPLFALHWFNPLGHLGWLALRRDQEAACDARVMAQKAPDLKATYANVIASFAAGPNVALAAPMACPVLGDKSIIHRLRSLQMSDLSSRRRMAGRGLLLGAALAVPLTASISYAEDIAMAVPAAPAAPMAPAVTGAPPAPPLAPAAPLAPLPPLATGLQSSAEVDVEKKVEKKVKIIRLEDGEEGEGGASKRKVKIVRSVDREQLGEHMSEAEIEEIMAEVRAGLAEADVAVEQAHVAVMEFKKEHDGGQHTVVEMKCEGDDVASSKLREDGTNVVMICQSKIMAHALTGLKQARDEIAKSSELTKELRKEVLRELDEQIESWAERDS